MFVYYKYIFSKHDPIRYSFSDSLHVLCNADNTLYKIMSSSNITPIISLYSGAIIF